MYMYMLACLTLYSVALWICCCISDVYNDSIDVYMYNVCACTVCVCVCDALSTILYYLLQASMIQAIERYMKQAIVDRYSSVSSAALISSFVSLQISPSLYCATYTMYTTTVQL